MRGFSKDIKVEMANIQFMRNSIAALISFASSFVNIVSSSRCNRPKTSYFGIAMPGLRTSAGLVCALVDPRLARTTEGEEPLQYRSVEEEDDDEKHNYMVTRIN
jgi:hypothetical protein